MSNEAQKKMLEFRCGASPRIFIPGWRCKSTSQIAGRRSDHLRDFRLVLDFRHDFNVRLLVDGFYDELAHQAGLIRYHDSNRCSHRLASDDPHYCLTHGN